MDSQLEKEKILNNILRLRKEKDATTAEIAQVLGMTRQGYHSIECGRSVLTLENAVKLARYYGISIEELIQVPFNLQSSMNEITLPLYIENPDGLISEASQRTISNPNHIKCILRDKNNDFFFFESTISPCYGKEMLFYHKEKLKRSVIYKNSSTSFAYIEDDKIITASFKTVHFLAVKIEINDLFL